MGQGLEVLARTLAEHGSRLITRQGPALQVLTDLIDETGARAVHWNRLYDPEAIARDKSVKAGLKDRGLSVESHAAHVLHEPWTVTTGQGGYYRVYSPMWKAVKHRDVPLPEPAPAKMPAPETWPASTPIKMGRGMDRGAAVLRPHLLLGEAAAATRLAAFLAGPVESYGTDRDRLDMDATSRLSEPLSYGEIGPRTIWHAGIAAMEQGAAGAEKFLKELVWRDFAHHLVYHTPHITRSNWREGWDSFPWSEEEDAQVPCLETGPHRGRGRRCRHARDVCDGPDAQPRPHAGRLLPDKAHDETLAHRHGLVC